MGTWNPPGGPTSGNDRFSGDATAESANGGAGDDRLLGNGGADTLEGGAGADIVNGGGANDIIIVRGDIVDEDVVDDVEDGESLTGGLGADTLQVQGQVSFFEAGVSLASFERLTFLTNDDVYNALTIRSSLLGPGLATTLAVTGAGGANFDQITLVSDSVGATIDVSGWTFSNWSQGAIYLIGDSGGNALTGTAFRDVLDGRDGADILRGGGGDDDLLGSQFGVADGATDHMYGGGGNDTYVVIEANDIVHESTAVGYDSVNSFVDYTLGANVEGVDLRGNVATTASGNELNNTVYGNEIGNTLFGLAGDDYMDGEQGNDTLNGGAGADQMLGRLGDDTYLVNHVDDIVEESTDEGVDLVKSTVDTTLTANVENLTLLGGAAISGTGNALANTIIGNGAGNALNGAGAADTINGGGGDDTINGGAGMDTLNGGGGADAFVFDRSLVPTNIDAINNFVAADDTIRLENSVFTGLTVGTLAAARFTVGASAGDAGDRIIYDSATGALYFDADGTGAAAQAQFATLATGLSLTAADFVVT